MSVEHRADVDLVAEIDMAEETVNEVVVGQGDSYEEALSDVKSAIRFHIDSFGDDDFDIDPPVIEAFVAEAGV